MRIRRGLNKMLIEPPSAGHGRYRLRPCSSSSWSAPPPSPTPAASKRFPAATPSKSKPSKPKYPSAAHPHHGPHRRPESAARRVSGGSPHSIGRQNRPEDRVVVVKSQPDVPYDRWIYSPASSPTPAGGRDHANGRRTNRLHQLKKSRKGLVPSPAKNHGDVYDQNRERGIGVRGQSFQTIANNNTPQITQHPSPFFIFNFSFYIFHSRSNPRSQRSFDYARRLRRQ